MNDAWETISKAGDALLAKAQIDAGADVDARNQYGQTALMIAAKNGHAALAQTLIAAGADLNVTAKYNLSALMLAVLNGHEEIIRALARAGANLEIRGSGAPGFENKTAYDLAEARGMKGVLVWLR